MQPKTELMMTENMHMPILSGNKGLPKIYGIYILLTLTASKADKSPHCGDLLYSANFADCKLFFGKDS